MKAELCSSRSFIGGLFSGFGWRFDVFVDYFLNDCFVVWFCSKVGFPVLERV